MAKDDLSPPEGRGIIPASYRVVGPDATAPGAFDVIADNADVINAFVFRQRQAVLQSTISQHRAQLGGPNVDIEYVRNQGEERITLRPYVRSSGPIIEGEVIPPEERQTLEQPVQPQPDLYLLVLYKTSHYAVFPMRSLGVGSDGKASASILASADLAKKGAAFGTTNIMVNQLTVGSVSVILAGVDMTGKTKGDKLCICTTALADAVPTTADNTFMPTMNGQGLKRQVTVYTPLASYSYDGKAFTLALDLTANGIAAYALAANGTSYFTEGFIGAATLEVYGAMQADIGDTAADYLKQNGETAMPSAACYTIYSTETQLTITNRLTVIEYGTYSQITPYLYGYNDRSYSQTSTAFDKLTSMLTVGGAALFDEPQPVSATAGSSYYASGPYGQTKPTVYNYILALTPKLYKAYDTGLNATTQHLGSLSSTDTSGQLPRPVFDQKKNAVAVVLDKVSASTFVQHHVSQGKVDYPKDDPFIYTPSSYYVTDPAGTSSDVIVPYPDTFSGYEEDEAANGRACGAYGVPPTTAGKACARATTPDDLQAEVQALFVTGTTTATQVQGQQGYSKVVTSKGTGFLSTPTITAEVTDGTSLASGNLVDSYPGIGSATDTPDETGMLTWHGLTIVQQQSITFYAFPPSLATAPRGGQETCFYAISKTPLEPPSDSKTTPVTTGPIDTRTPYGKYADELTPWLHAANSQHYMQGFAIGQAKTDTTAATLKNHLFLDGGDFMPYLTSILSCKENDIVAAFMDVPLSAIQGLAKITSATPAST